MPSIKDLIELASRLDVRVAWVRLDEQRDADAGVPEPRHRRSEMSAPAGGVEEAAKIISEIRPQPV